MVEPSFVVSDDDSVPGCAECGKPKKKPEFKLCADCGEQRVLGLFFARVDREERS